MSAERFHFIGIGGVGMAGLAALVKSRGCEVSGCDISASGRTRWLESLGIRVFLGHDISHLADVDVVVVTPAIPDNAPELVEARRRGIRVECRGAALARLFSAGRGIAVCGTHGKTTTATFAARLLRALGDNPEWCIGGETGDMPVAGPFPHSGPGPIVAEADESDGTLALYSPEILVVNAVDFDHLEHFTDREAYFECYRGAIARTKRRVIVCADHPRAVELVRESSRAEVVSFGFSEDADIKASDWPPPGVGGRHNVLNALAAIAVALALGHDGQSIRAALAKATCKLPNRRFETIAVNGRARLITDYAHHPEEIRCALEMARSSASGRVRVLFQPHRHTRTAALTSEFASAFDNADDLVIAPVYAAFEKPVPGGDSADLYRAIRERGKTPILARNLREGWRQLFLSARDGDTVILLGAGDIIGIVDEARRDFASFPAPRKPVALAKLSFFGTGGFATGEGERTAVGAGSNIWFPDGIIDGAIERVFDPGAEPSAFGEWTPAGCLGAKLVGAFAAFGFMAGIPGTVGGWVRMNAGAFGHSVSELVDAVKMADGRILSAAECGFGYRSSLIDGTIEAVRFHDAPAAMTSAQALAKRRAFPPRSCGSVFRNPPGDFAGRLLEEAGLKGARVGGARVWEEHANVIAADGEATSSDILALARLMAAAVRWRFGIELESEIRGLETK